MLVEKAFQKSRNDSFILKENYYNLRIETFFIESWSHIKKQFFNKREF